jgi:hypothetical protein
LPLRRQAAPKAVLRISRMLNAVLEWSVGRLTTAVRILNCEPT